MKDPALPGTPAHPSTPHPASPPSPHNPPAASDAVDESTEALQEEGQDVQGFLQGLLEKKKQRKHQLELIQQFFQNPVDFGVQPDFVPCSTNVEEIAEYKKYLNYRIDLLRSVLAAMEGELRLLEMVEEQAQSPPEGGK